MSKAYSIPAVTRTLRIALEACAKKFKVHGGKFVGINAYQKLLLQKLLDSDVKASEDALSNKELITSVKIDQNSIVTNTVLSVNVEYKTKGVESDGYKHKGVKLSKDFEVLDENCVKIHTKSGDTIFLHKKTFVASNSLVMASKIKALYDKYCNAKSDKSFTSLVFPHTNATIAVDMTPLLGLEYGNLPAPKNEYSVSEASQNITFVMDTVGAKVKVEVSIRMATKGLPPKPPKQKVFVIDGPYVVWITKPKCVIPYFTGIMQKDAFKI